MLRFYLAALLVAGLTNRGDAACVSRLEEIYHAEKLLTDETDTNVVRTYTLCPKTNFSPGQANETGFITGGDVPLVCRRNCHIRCGDDGSSSNNCKIEGSIGTYGIFMIPYLVFIDRPTEAENIVIQGVTIEQWTNSDQIPVLSAAPYGDVTFMDCVFKNNKADPLFVIDQFLLGTTNSERNRRLEMTSGFKYPLDREKLGRRLSDIPEDERADVVTDRDERHLVESLFSVTFQQCRFELNNPIENPKTPGGLSLVRFRGADPSNAFDQVGSLDATFVGNTFVDNNYNVPDDGAEHRSMIDFYSQGQLEMRENCFLSSPVRGFGVVTVQAGASLTNQGNYVAEKQGDLNCEFIARLDQLYDKKGCGTPAAANKCLATPPGPAPTLAPAGGGGGFCFPGDATCQVEGQGQVLMKDLKLGDKVLVQGGKYEPVYSFGHHAQELEALYLKFVTTAARSLELSKEHMVFIEGGRSVPASYVKVGDKLELADGELATVKAIRLVQKQGAYAPFTASGTVIVNGVKASSFVSFQDSETLQVAGIDTGLTFQFLEHTFERPHRLWCRYVSICTYEQYTADGIPLRLDFAHKAVRWYFDVNSSMVMTMAIAFPFLACIAMIANPVASLIALAAILVAIHRPVRFLRLKSA